MVREPACMTSCVNRLHERPAAVEPVRQELTSCCVLALSAEFAEQKQWAPELDQVLQEVATSSQSRHAHAHTHALWQASQKRGTGMASPFPHYARPRPRPPASVSRQRPLQAPPLALALAPVLSGQRCRA